jgi:hypothetical protein
VVVHGTGWRAEHARVEALAVPATDEQRLVSALRRIAERLEVPLVARAALPEVAAAAGAAVPNSLRPAATP